MKCACAKAAQFRGYHGLDTNKDEDWECVSSLSDSWEAIFRCNKCGQLWHMRDCSGHAIVKYFEEIDQTDADALIAEERENQLERDRKHTEWLERERTRPPLKIGVTMPREPPLWLQLAVGIPMLGGSAIIFVGILSGPGPFQDRCTWIGGLLVVAAMAVSALNWLLKQRKR